MKKIICLIIINVIPLIILNGQQAWQKISSPGIREISMNFTNPPPEYGAILWWGWDGPMTDTVIKRDLDRIKLMGFKGVMLEAGYGMTAKYLSPEWFSMVKIAVEEAKKRDMRVWVEDEGKYPSGFAGGKFSTERPDLKMQALVITEKIDVPEGKDVSKKLPFYAVSAVAYNKDDSTSKIIDISSGELNWKAADGNWRIFIAGHRFRSSVTRSVNNPTRGKDTTASLMDYLNPLATSQFLEWTHEEYKKYIGDEFGKTFMGFMGDEPDFAYTPWTPAIVDEFIKRKGYDVKPNLALLFTPQLIEEAKRVKADYWDVWSDLFRDNFFSVQANWCRENKIEYIVHLNHEDQLPGLVRSSGDYFKNMRNVGIPGVDAIWAQIWMDHVSDYPKLASSASHLYGRPRAFTESFAAYTHKPSVQQAKWVLDYQLVRGINWIQIMFMSASANRPPSANNSQGTARRLSFFQTDSFPAVAAYLNRASYLLSQGRPAADIGLYFPTLSMWYGDNESNTSLLSISQQLMENQHDFDFVDEQALSSIMIRENWGLKNLSGQSYRTIIIPSISAISSGSISVLKDFALSGGKVIFAGTLPSLVVDENFRNAVKPDEFSWALKIDSTRLIEEMSKSGINSDLKIDKTLPQIKYLHRVMNDADLYFIFNESLEEVQFNVTFREKGKKQTWDAETGKISDLIGSSLSMGPWDTRFIVIKK